jgi:hypothetical protein
MSIVLLGSTSGSCTLQEQAVAGTTTLTLPTFNGTVGLLVSGTAVSASGTAVDFTGLPAGVRRITVMFNGVSTSGTSIWLLQLGDSGGIENTGYNGQSTANSSSPLQTTSTAGFPIYVNAATYNPNGILTITNISGNIWVVAGVLANITTAVFQITCAGSKELSATLDRVRLTTTNGTDTFDAGTINILYE